MKTALITGASKGIGYAIADALVRADHHVCITSRNEVEINDAAARLNLHGKGRALPLVCDVRDFNAQCEAVMHTVKEFGRLDVLVANAGIGHFASVDELTVEQWAEVIDTNLTGVFYSVKAAVEELKKTRGMIITIGSLAGRNPFAGGSAYNASKFGLCGFSEAIMLDLRRHGIRVSTIMPGSVATHFNQQPPSEADAWKIQPEDIARLVLTLLEMPERTLPSRIEVRPSQPPAR
jgi:NADP-dependent 3-hydroxy acid dehydrogenase YdfG